MGIDQDRVGEPEFLDAFGSFDVFCFSKRRVTTDEDWAVAAQGHVRKRTASGYMPTLQGRL